MCTKRFMGYRLDVGQFCGTGRMMPFILVTIFIILVLQMTSLTLREVSLGQLVNEGAGPRTGLLRYPLQCPLRKAWHGLGSRGTSHFTSVGCSKWFLLDQREKSPGRQQSGGETAPQATRQPQSWSNPAEPSMVAPPTQLAALRVLSSRAWPAPGSAAGQPGGGAQSTGVEDRGPAG